MPSTYSTNLRLELQATGENRTTWGTKANNDFTLIEAAIAGYVSIAMADANVTLTTNNGATDQARMAVLNFTGANTAIRTVTIPSVSKIYTIINATTGGFAINVKTSAGNTLVIPAGGTRQIYCDGTNTAFADGVLPLTGGTMSGALDMSTTNKIVNLANGTANTDATTVGQVYTNILTYTPSTWMQGLISSKASSTSVTIGSGQAKGSSFYTSNGSNFTKDLAVVWAAGTGQGGRDTAAALVANGTYHIHVIANNTTSVFDFLFSASATAPTVPSGWTRLLRIGSVVLDASSVIRGYTQSGNKFVYDTAYQEATLSSSFSKALVTWASIPNGVSVDVLGIGSAQAVAGSAGSANITMYDGNLASGVQGYSLNSWAVTTSTASGVTNIVNAKVRSNTAQQIYLSTSVGGTGGNLGGINAGWDDYTVPRIGV